MTRFIFIFSFCCATFLSQGQKKINPAQFTTEQKQEWNMFIQEWGGNGNGTCMPMMENLIDSAKCSKFEFFANLTIGNNGMIKKVKRVKSKIQCELKPIEKELLDCFVSTLKMDMNFRFKALKGKTILNAAL